MTIEWDEAARQFHLSNGQLSEVLVVHAGGAVGPVHLGAPLTLGRSYRHLLRQPFSGFSNRLADPVGLSMPTPGGGDYRVPGLVVEQPDGSTVLELVYRAHRIVAGKPDLGALPATYVEADEEADTLEIDLADERSGVVVTLAWSIFRDRPVIAQSARIRNEGPAAVHLTTAMSAVLDLPNADWELIQLSGAWARERHVVTRRLRPGRQSVASNRGVSSAAHNPLLVLRRPSTTEGQGEALAVLLAYSGNHLEEAEVDPSGATRLRAGINPEGFRWALEPGAAFQTPEALVAWTGDGLGALSDGFHGVLRERMARGHWRDRPRPVLVNNWEGTYFDFDEERLVAMATVAKDLGIELFVLDDGWFGKRDADDSSLGDWFVDRRKLPDGLDGLSRRITGLGLAFGLWIEPEMVSSRSELFAAHPDWAIGVPGRPRTEGRQQLVLDLGRPEVVDHLEHVLAEAFTSGSVAYVKWDMNRWITEPWSGALPADRQGEFFHRYVLGVYELYRRLTTRFPDVLFESCASGGERFDAGMLAFAPQAWTSDDTDAIERLAIQWGTSLAYPLSSMGAHVSAVPNHQIGRVTPLSTRAAVAFFGDLGYELDPTALTEAERAEIRGQIAFYREHRELFQRGRFLRLRGPFEGDGNTTAWMVVSDDRSRAIVGFYRVLNRPNPGIERLPLRGLAADRDYRITVWPAGDDALSRANAGTRRGDDLIATGLFLEVGRHEAAELGDFLARLFVLDAS